MTCRSNQISQRADIDGFANEPISYPLEVLPDKSPIVLITLPAAQELRLRPAERLAINAEIVEDFGFLDTALVITPDGAAEPIVLEKELPQPTNRANQFSIATTLDLSSLKLTEQQKRIAVQLQIRDNRPADFDGPGVGLSDPIYITIDGRAKSLAQQAIEAQKKEINENLQEAKRELERARDDMRRVEQELQRDEEVNSRARDELSEFSDRTESARERLDEVVATLNQTLFQEQANMAATISNETIGEARERADLIPVTDGKKERIDEARAARQKTEEAISQVDEVSKAMRDADEEYRLISELNDLASRQQELAMNAEEWARQNQQNSEDQSEQTAAQKRNEQQKMNQFKSQQNQVQQQLGQMLKDNAEALEQVLKSQRDQAETMAEVASELAEEQESLKQISEKVTRAPHDQQETLKEQLMDALQQQQNALADAAQRAATSEDKMDESEAESLLNGAEQGFKTAKNLEGDNLNEAAESAQAASEALAEAAADARQTIEEGQERTAAGNPESEVMANRQAMIAAQIEAVKEGNLQAALSLMEAALNSEAEALGAEAQAFETAMKNLSQESASRAADQAEKSLQRGAQEAEQSSRQLSQAQTQQSRAEANNQVDPGEIAKDAQASMQRSQGDQSQSASQLRQAADALNRSADSIGQTMEGLEPSDADSQVADSSDLAEGFEEVSEASQSQDAQEASQQSREAAEALQQLAQAAMQKLGNPGQPQSNPQDDPNQLPSPNLTGDPNGDNLNESGEKSADIRGDGIPPELREMGISVEDWTRFRGALVGGNAAAIETDLPAEYRELVGRYFQVIAKEAGK